MKRNKAGPSDADPNGAATKLEGQPFSELMAAARRRPEFPIVGLIFVIGLVGAFLARAYEGISPQQFAVVVTGVVLMAVIVGAFVTRKGVLRVISLAAFVLLIAASFISAFYEGGVTKVIGDILAERPPKPTGAGPQLNGDNSASPTTRPSEGEPKEELTMVGHPPSEPKKPISPAPVQPSPPNGLGGSRNLGRTCESLRAEMAGIPRHKSCTVENYAFDADRARCKAETEDLDELKRRASKLCP